MKAQQIGVRMTDEDLELLRRVCEARREDVSDFVRRSIMIQLGQLGFVKASTLKALGLRENIEAE